tara:strand:+ start:11310 stop:12080 length:771 start_codon:yes stop_codon:yes gene_type:complete
MLSNKIIVVTGGSGLIGRSFVKAIVESSGTAIIADINEESGRRVCDDLSFELDTKNIDFIQMDITKKESIQQCLLKLDEKYGKIDGLVNNAYPRNKRYGKHFFDVEYEDFVENVGLNLGGYFLTSQQFAKYFQDQGYGNIINISSIYGVIAPEFDIYENTSMTTPPEYAAIKSGLIHLTKYMAKYFSGNNIRVNSLSPGGIFDNQNQDFLEAYKKRCLSKGMLNAEDLNGALTFLLSDSSKFVNGQNIIVDDGFTL